MARKKKPRDIGQQLQPVTGAVGAFLPYGQDVNLPKYQSPKTAEQFKNSPTEWPSEVMSFELWCACTLYEPGETDGGERFQQMMALLLVDGNKTVAGGSGYLERNKPEAPYCGVKSAAPGFERRGPWGAILETHKSENKQSVHVSKHMASRAGRGLVQGHISGLNDLYDREGAKWRIAVASMPLSKNNWFMTHGMFYQTSDFGPRGRPQNNSMTFIPGVRTATAGQGQGCNETQGCMAFGNHTAGLFGLYYYEGCEDASRNWTVQQTVDGKTFTVRMRLWNPRYDYQPGYGVIVKEFLRGEGRRLMGNQHAGERPLGFALSVRMAMAPRDALRFTDKELLRVTGVVAGSAKLPFPDAKREVVRARSRELSQLLGPIASAPALQEGLEFFFGFRFPRAHWLYPHSYERVELVGGGELVDWAAHGRYQAWPRLAAHGAEMLKSLKESEKVYQAFDEAYFADDEAQIRHLALFDRARGAQVADRNPPVVRRVPQTVERPARPPAQPDDSELERSLDDAPGLEGVREATDGADQFEQEGASVAQENLYTDLRFSEAHQLDELTVEVIEEQEGSAPAQRAALEEGAQRAAHDVNLHFAGTMYQPWPHEDVFAENQMKLVGAEMSAAETERYARTYGSTHNLYLRGEQVPRHVRYESVKGTAKPLLFESIAADNALCRKHLCRIIAIYFYDGPIGVKRGTEARGGLVISEKERRDGMRWGVFTTADAHATAPKLMFPGSADARRRLKNDRRSVELWPPVFKSGFNPRSFAKKDFAVSFGKRVTVVDELACGKYESKIKAITSDMRVLDWVTSPWHYAFLPYLKKRVLFADGETYSEGCTRCSRPFFEFPERRMWYLNAIPGTESWSASLWRPDGLAASHAPLPFHDERLWRRGVVGRAARSDVVRGGALEEPHGWHAWCTDEFKIKDDLLASERERRKLSARGARLSKVAQGLYVDKIAPTFRRYDNHVYDASSPLCGPGGAYTSFTQGRISYGRSKCGMREVRLQRSAKYGNCCTDCAAVLERAPGLLVRNHSVRYQTGMLEGNFSLQRIPHTWWTNLFEKHGVGDPRFDTEAFFHGGRLSRIRDRAERERKQAVFERTMERVRKKLEDIHGNRLGRETKLRNPPSIHVQTPDWKGGAGAQRESAEQREQSVTLALADIDAALEGHTTPRPKNRTFARALEHVKREFGQTSDRMIAQVVAYAQRLFDESGADASAAVRRERQRLLQEMRRWALHSTSFRFSGSRKFSADEVRWEKRNAALSFGGARYENCLVTREWHPRGIERRVVLRRSEVGAGWRPGEEGTVTVGTRADGRPQTQRVRFPASGDEMLVKYTPMDDDSYTERAFYATMLDRAGRVRSPPEKRTMWAGDGNVMRWDERASKWVSRDGDAESSFANEQWRDKRQSRFFITYSLHRPVTEETEARGVMERVADAVRALFGTDRLLSEILVFGHQIVKARAGRDSVSAASFEPIRESKAASKGTLSGRFYAGSGGTSYIYDTYETHVDSVDVDGGVEIGPNRKHPHFHVLLTVNHWSYVQLDYFKMNALLEQMFRGKDPLGFGWGAQFKLLANDGAPFYTDAENPHVDIKLYPQDNWNDVIAAYVRKNSSPGIFEAIGVRTGRL